MVYDNAKAALKESGLTYRAVGIQLGYPAGTARQKVYEELNGKRPPSLELMQKVSELTGREQSWLFF